MGFTIDLLVKTHSLNATPVGQMCTLFLDLLQPFSHKI